MAYALVGTIGVASQGAASAAVTPAWGTGESRTAGNLLICFCSVTGVATAPTTPSGWSVRGSGPVGSANSYIFYKIAAGGDAAPTIAAITSGVIAAQLAEFSGNSATPLDKEGSRSGATTSPATATFGAADTAAGELMVVASADFRSVARAPNNTLTSNNATITQAGNNNGVSSVNHYSFGYALATNSNAAADTAVLTCSVTTSITNLGVWAVTFKIAPQALTLTTSEALATSESADQDKSTARSTQEGPLSNLKPTEVLTRTIGWSRTTIEGPISNLKPVESLIRSGAFVRPVTDSSSTAEAADWIANFKRSANDSASVSESATAVVVHTPIFRTCTESLLGTDEIPGLNYGDGITVPWKDSSGNGNATPVGVPIFYGDSVWLGNTTTYFTFPTVTAPKWTIIAVIVRSNGNQNCVMSGDDGSHTNPTPEGIDISGANFAYLSGDGARFHFDVSPYAGLHIFSATSDQGAVYYRAFWADGTALGATYDGGWPAQYNFNLIGARGDLANAGSNSFYLRELIFYDHDITFTEVANLEAYLSAQHGVTVASSGTPVLPTTISGLKGWWKATSFAAFRGCNRTLLGFRAPVDAPTSAESADRSIITAGVSISRTATESLSTAESATRAAPKARTTADALSIAETIANSAAHPRTATDALATAEAITKTATHPRTATDAPTTAEAITKTAAHPRTTSDALTTAEVASFLSGRLRLATEALATAESADWVGSLLRSVPDSLTTAELAIEGAVHSRTATDALSTSESASAVRGTASISRTATESLSTSEAISKTATHPRAAAEALTTADVAVRAAPKIRTATDALTTADTATRAWATNRSVTEAIFTADAAARLLTLFRSVVDACNTLESATAARTTASISRSAVDNLSTTESVIRLVTLLRTATDVLSTSESVVATKFAFVQRTASENLSTSESAKRVLAALRSCSDNPLLAESVARAVTTARTALDAPHTAEAITKSATHPRSATDALSTAELAVASRFGTLARSAIDSLATGESAQRALAVLRSSLDALLIAEAVSAVRSTGTFTRIALDALGTAEAAIRTLAVTRGTTDALAITQAVTIGRSFARTTIDHLSTLETCVAIVQVGGPWEYVLPFPTGNSPLISNLQYVDP